MSIRFSDNILSNIEGSGFVVRNRVPRSMQIILIFLGAFDLICFAAYFTNESNVNIPFLMVLIISLGILGSITFYFIEKFRNLILATEFQSLMLASATQIGTRFCFITNTDGMLFYIDPGFQKTFPAFIDNGSRTLSEFCAIIAMPDDLRKRIFDTLKQARNDYFLMTFNDKDGHLVKMMTSIDAIARPRGYFIIRGRDYVEKRADETHAARESEKALAQLSALALEALPGGVLIADHTGRICMVNHELEHRLGFGEGEILEMKMSVGQVLHHYSNHAPGAMLLNNYEGEAGLKCKDGETIKAHIHQRLLGDDEKTFGISVLIEIK